MGGENVKRAFDSSTFTRAGRLSVFSILAVGLLSVLVFAAAQASATIITVTPICRDPRLHLNLCSFNPKDYSIGAGETPTLSIPSEAESFQFHNVTATQKGADGRPLFQSPDIGPGQTTSVDGTQYLPPGTYPFICTIHAVQTVPMTGKLVITDNGATPLARQTIDVRVPAQPLRGILKRGRVMASVQAPQSAEGVLLTLKVDGRKSGTVAGLSLEPNVPQTIEIPLNGAGRSTLKDVKSAVIYVQGSARFGALDTARRKVR
jgi:plastocyanin